MSLSISTQPASSSLNAAYRPIVLTVTLTSLMPIVYCDIYVEGVFYKSLSSTAPLLVINFDIQIEMQEILGKFLAANGGTEVVEASSLTLTSFCRIRGSSTDSNGFVLVEAPIPIQATGGTPAVAGGGVSSNSFYVVNSTLQNEDNQNLLIHLNTLKSAGWTEPNSWPLSQRKSGYKVGSSDYFPFITTSKTPKCFSVRLLMKDGSIVTHSTCSCEPVGVPAFSFGHATVGSFYTKTITVTGSGPFTFFDVVAPSWMVVNVSGASITFKGTPTATAEDQPAGFSVSNGCGLEEVAKTIDVTEVTCIPVAIVGVPDLPDATVGVFYSYSFNLSGDANFTFGATTKPSWMNIGINEFTKVVTLSGTPTAEGTDIPVDLIITNCGGANSVPFNDTMNVSIPTATINGSLAIGSATGLVINLEDAVSCDVSFEVHGFYDEGGVPTEFSATVTVLGGNTEGNLFNAAPNPITCITPTDPPDIYISSATCGGVSYTFNLTVADPC